MSIPISGSTTFLSSSRTRASVTAELPALPFAGAVSGVGAAVVALAASVAAGAPESALFDVNSSGFIALRAYRLSLGTPVLRAGERTPRAEASSRNEALTHARCARPSDERSPLDARAFSRLRRRVHVLWACMRSGRHEWVRLSTYLRGHPDSQRVGKRGQARYHCNFRARVCVCRGYLRHPQSWRFDGWQRLRADGRCTDAHGTRRSTRRDDRRSRFDDERLPSLAALHRRLHATSDAVRHDYGSGRRWPGRFRIAHPRRAAHA